MKNQHTPGPWLRSKSGNTFQIVAGKDMNEEPNTLVANIPPIGYNCDYEPCDETKANAHLIASAPDLLEALRFLLADYIAINGEKLTGSSVPIEMAQAAIAKAEGVK